MKKLSLLVLAGLAAMGTASASRFDVIKDGKLVNGIEMPYENAAEGAYDTYKEEATAPDGSKALQILHSATAYQDIRIDLTKESEGLIDLNKNYMMVVEYYVGDECVDSAEDPFELFGKQRPVFTFGMWDAKILTDSVVDKETGKKKAKPIDVNTADVVATVDAKLVDAKVLNTKQSFLFANPDLKEAGILSIGVIREFAGEYSDVYIKNLWFGSLDGGPRPFYAEDFQRVGANRMAVYSPGALKGFAASDYAGGYEITSTGAVPSNRAWVNDESKFLDTEIYECLLVQDKTTAKSTESTPREIQVKDIVIPSGNDGKLYVSGISKFIWSEEEAPIFEEQYGAKIPAFAIFNDANNTKVALFGDSIVQYNWTEAKSVLDIPAGATQVTLSFEHVDFDYGVDNIMLSTKNNVDNKEVIVASKAVIYVANDEVVSPNAEKIEIISLAGAVVASANEASVNIAALPAGVYVVKVANAEGISVAKIIKK